MSYEVQRMLPRHHAIVEMALNGLSNAKIAECLDMTPQAVGQIVLSPIVQNELARRRGERGEKLDKAALDYVSQAREEVEKASIVAAKTLRGLLDSSDERIRLNSASKILDQVFASKDSNKTAGGNLILNVDQIQNLQIALVESRRDNPVFDQMDSQSETSSMATT